MDFDTSKFTDSAVIAIDIGGTSIKAGLCSSTGEIIFRGSRRCTIANGLSHFLETVENLVSELIHYSSDCAKIIVGVGAAVPGIADPSGVVRSSINLAPLVGFNLRNWLQSTLMVPAAMLNDANAAAYAEMAYGAGKRFDSFLHFTLGTGVGSGLVLNREVWTGKRGIAAEYGHATVEADGRVCNCGNHGCLEQYSSATGIVLTAKEYLENGVDSSLKRFNQNELNAEIIAMEALNGDQVSQLAYQMAGKYIGLAAASAVNLLDLEAVVIGGGVSESFELIKDAINCELQLRVFPEAREGIKVCKSELGNDAGVLGAAAAAWSLVQSA